MSRLKWCGPTLGAACLLVLALTGTFWAQDKKGMAEKHDAKSLRESLKDVINNGADLFNKYGDHAGCYRLFQGALLSVKPFLQPAAQKEIDDALARAERMSRFSEKAFELRKVIDHVRAQALQAPPMITEVPPPKKKIEDKAPPKVKVEAPKTALWDRLGGEASVRKVIADFTKAAAADPKVNFSRDGKYKLDETTVQLLEDQVVDFVSSVTGGPLKYDGKNMKDAHKGMGITNGEYDATAKHLKKALEKNGAKVDDVTAVMQAVEGLRKDIVESKKKKVAPKADAPKADAPKQNAPKTDAPKKDGPKIDAPKKDAPKADSSPKEVGSIKTNGEMAKASGKVLFEGKPAPTGYFTLVSTKYPRPLSNRQARCYSAFTG